MKIAVILVNYNSSRDMMESVPSLEESNLPTGFERKVFVVENGSKVPGEWEVLQSLKQYPDVELILSEKNTGFTGGNNLGLKQGKIWGADYFLLLNVDTKVSKNFLMELIKPMRFDKQIGLASPKIYFYPGFETHKERYKQSDSGKVLWYAGGILDLDNIVGSHRGVDEVDTGQYDSPYEGEVLTPQQQSLPKIEEEEERARSPRRWELSPGDARLTVPLPPSVDWTSVETEGELKLRKAREKRQRELEEMEQQLTDAEQKIKSLKNEPSKPNPDHIQYEDTDFATGCCLLLSRDVLEKVGYLDDRLFFSWEDTDYSMRARDKSFRVIYVPLSVIWHKNASTSGGTGSPIQDYYQTRNRVIFSLRYGPLRTSILLIKTLLKSRNPNRVKAVFAALRTYFLSPRVL